MRANYTGELKVGAVYQSHDPRITRRVMSVRNGCVRYVYMEGRKWPSTFELTEEMFREFTSHEVDMKAITGVSA